MKPEFEAYWNADLLKDQPLKIKCLPADRNKQPILNVIQTYLDPSTAGHFLEISSGSGQHIAHISPKFPQLTFQPTDIEPHYLTSIKEYIRDEGLVNVLEPVHLDVGSPVEFWGGSSLKPNSVDFVLNINLMHVSPWSCSEGLFRGVSTLLKPGGLLFTYGAFAVDGIIVPESNAEFDRNLRKQNTSWGLRDINRELIPLASQVNMSLAHRHDLPANNMMLVWKKNTNS